MIEKEVFKTSGSLKSGFRVVNGLIQVRDVTPSGIMFKPAMKSKNEQWTIWDSSSIIWRLSQSIGEDKICELCGITIESLRVQRYIKVKSEKLFERLMKIESEIKGATK